MDILAPRRQRKEEGGATLQAAPFCAARVSSLDILNFLRAFCRIARLDPMRLHRQMKRVA